MTVLYAQLGSLYLLDEQSNANNLDGVMIQLKAFSINEILTPSSWDKIVQVILTKNPL